MKKSTGTDMRVHRVGGRRFYEKDVRRHLMWGALGIAGLFGSLFAASEHWKTAAIVLFSSYLASAFMFVLDIALTKDAPKENS